MTRQDEISPRIREIVCRILPGIEVELSDDSDIFAHGLDSVSTMLLIDELENSYGITLNAEEIPYEKFRTINDIAAFLAAVPDVQIRGSN